MAKPKKKIYLLLAGGTCIFDQQGHIFNVNSATDIDSWLAMMPELSILADIESILICSEDQLIGPDTWQKIAKNILAKVKSADGFIVVTKIDQLINTSLAINFLLQNFKQTIIFTGSQISGSSFIDKKETISKLKSKYGGSGLRTNLINAIQVASEPLPNPAVLFGSRLIEATKVLASQTDNAGSFVSQDGKYLAKIDFGINLKSGLKYSPKKAEVYSDLSAKVLILEDLPGSTWTFAKKDLVAYDGIFVRVLPFQPLSEDKQTKINEWKLPTVIYNPYSVAPVKGAVLLSGCSANAALIKTIWALSNQKKLPKFEDIMRQNIIGEFKE